MKKRHELLRDIHTAAIAASLPPDKRWVDSEAAAAMIGVPKRKFLERIACRDDFPVPSRPTGPTGFKVWRVSEVDAWMERQREMRDAA